MATEGNWEIIGLATANEQIVVKCDVNCNYYHLKLYSTGLLINHKIHPTKKLCK
jgi:hypothetical protein